MPASRKPSRTTEMIELPADFVPGPSHVICAKGKQAKQHPANRFLKSLVQAHLVEYSECPSKLERSFLVSKMIKMIRQQGGFVRNIDGTWCDVGDRNAREKIGQAFRDSLHTKYKSSTKAKASMRRQRASTSSTGSVSSGSRSDASTAIPVALPTPSFPIMEVSFDARQAACITPEVSSTAKRQVEFNFRDFEPLPLKEALSLDFSLPFVAKDDASFKQAMDEMFECHFSDSSENAFAF